MIEIKVYEKDRNYSHDVVFVANDYDEVAEVVRMLKKYGKDIGKIEIIDSNESETKEEE